MDIKTAVLNQLNEANGLYSLILQNHLYGCFILMEDIAQNKFEVKETLLSTPTFKFDYDTQFSEIGLRYGFVMDTKLALICTPEYKDIWLTQFKQVNESRNIDEVDKIEECLHQVINTIKPEDAFYTNALDTGSLTQEWIEKVLQLLNPVDEEVDKTAISIAITEKPIRRQVLTRRKPKETTRYKTRRNR